MRKYGGFVLLALSFLSASLAHGASGRPNIVFILADDLGARDLGCYGSTYHESPHIDKLAERGMRFQKAYAAHPQPGSVP